MVSIIRGAWIHGDLKIPHLAHPAATNNKKICFILSFIVVDVYHTCQMVSIIEGDWIQRFQSCSYLPVMHCDAVFSFIVRGKILIEREEGTETNSGTSSASSFSFSFEVNCFLFTALMAQSDTDGASLHED